MLIRHAPQWDHKHEHFFGRNLETCTQKSHHNGKNPFYVNAYAGLEVLARNIFIFEAFAVYFFALTINCHSDLIPAFVLFACKHVND